MTDTDRLDWLNKQKFTKWVGYTIKNGNVVHPVFDGQDLRKAIDDAMAAQKRHQEWENTQLREEGQ